MKPNDTKTLTDKIEKNILSMALYSKERFINDGNRYIAALKSGRLIYVNIKKAQSSKTFNIESFEGDAASGYFDNYIGFFRALGENITKENYIKVSGSGSDLAYALNFETITSLQQMGFVDISEGAKLSKTLIKQF